MWTPTREKLLIWNQILIKRKWRTQQIPCNISSSASSCAAIHPWFVPSSSSSRQAEDSLSVEHAIRSSTQEEDAPVGWLKKKRKKKNKEIQFSLLNFFLIRRHTNTHRSCSQMGIVVGNVPRERGWAAGWLMRRRWEALEDFDQDHQPEWSF